MANYNQRSLKYTPQLMFTKVMQLNGVPKSRDKLSPLQPHSCADAYTKKSRYKCAGISILYFYF
jgi:hypothetical protein